MREKIEARLADLKDQFSQGQEQLKVKEREIADLRNTLLRISGAIQVLEETLGDTDPDTAAEAAQ